MTSALFGSPFSMGGPTSSPAMFGNAAGFGSMGGGVVPVRKSCGILGLYNVDVDCDNPYERGEICGQFGIMNTPAMPTQKAQYCAYKKNVEQMHREQVFAQVGALPQETCSNHYTKCIKNVSMPMAKCPTELGAVQIGGYCCDPISLTTSCITGAPATGAPAAGAS